MEDSTFVVKSYTITATDAWSHVFAGEDKYDANGDPYYYYVVETACSPDYYDLTSYTGDPVGNASAGTITVTNEAKRGNLTISKTLATTNPAGDPNKSFTFTITFSGDKATGMASSYSAIKTVSGTTSTISVQVNADKQVTVTLKANESVKILDLPYGVTYTITETADPDYEDVAGSNGTVDQNSSESFINTRAYGQITVTKTVQLNGTADALTDGKKFWVGIYTDEQASVPVSGQSAQEITIGSNGTGSTTFSNLPFGTYYVYELTGENGTPVTGAKATIGSVIYTVTTDNTGAVISKASRNGTASVINNRTSVNVQIIKIDATTNTQLTGAKFQMQRKEGSEYVRFENEQFAEDAEHKKTGEFEIVSTDGIIIPGLIAGDYKIAETSPPDGYNQSNIEIYFTVNPDGSTTWKNSLGETITSQAMVAYTAKNGTTPATFTVGNTPGAVLPVTGGPGTWLYTLLGLTLVLTAGMLLTNGRKRRERD